MQRRTSTCGRSAAIAASSPGRHRRWQAPAGAEATGGQSVQESAPSGLALAAYVLEAEQHLLPVAAHAESDQHRQTSGALVETNAHDRAVEDETNKADSSSALIISSIKPRMRPRTAISSRSNQFVQFLAVSPSRRLDDRRKLRAARGARTLPLIPRGKSPCRLRNQ